MDQQSQRPPRGTTLRDTIGLAGIAVILYVMFSSVVAYREPDWGTFWLGLAAFVAWTLFYGRCARAVEDFVEAQRDHFPAHRAD